MWILLIFTLENLETWKLVKLLGNSLIPSWLVLKPFWVVPKQPLTLRIFSSLLKQYPYEYPPGILEGFVQSSWWEHKLPQALYEPQGLSYLVFFWQFFTWPQAHSMISVELKTQKELCRPLNLLSSCSLSCFQSESRK